MGYGPCTTHVDLLLLTHQLQSVLGSTEAEVLCAKGDLVVVDALLQDEGANFTIATSLQFDDLEHEVDVVVTGTSIVGGDELDLAVVA